jgi:hypothetical protein
MSPIKRAEINRENAKHSTGPKTPEGKRRASLNALKHGLTGQTVVLPGDDPHAFIDFCEAYQKELKPCGILETQLVFTIAQTQWRMNRAGAWEDDIVSLGVAEHSESINTDDPAIACALAQGKTVLEQMAKLATLSIYHTRFTRTLHQSLEKLHELQTRRKAEEEEALKKAAEVYWLAKAKQEDFEPSEIGFDFSTERLEQWMVVQEIQEEASDYVHLGRLPVRDDEEEAIDDKSAEPLAA